MYKHLLSAWHDARLEEDWKTYLPEWLMSSREHGTYIFKECLFIFICLKGRAMERQCV